MPLNDLRDSLNESLKLPINGVIYEVQPITADVGLRFIDTLNVTAKLQDAKNEGKEPSADDIEILTDAAEHDMYRDALADSWEVMTEDGLTFAELKTAALFVIMHGVYGEEIAERFWNSGGKELGRNRAERRTATRTRTVAATTTKKPASRTGTTTRKATRKTAG